MFRWAATIVACLFALNGAVADEPAIVFLHGGRDSAFPEGNGNYLGLLGRELIRQALLCAARDELSCATYDLHLGQPAPNSATHLDIVAVRGLDRADAPPSQLELLRGEPPMQELITAATFKSKSPVDVVELVRLLEARSRTGFVKQLQQAGVAGQPRPWNRKAVPSDPVLKALAEMSFVSQFRAACGLHEQIEREGRSAALTAALVRAYANLAVLTELHWAPAHKVFAARSLIYAQRLVAGKHDNTLAFTSRAYAYALAGLHQAALDDLDALDKLAAEGKAKPGELPRILRSYCNFRIAELDPARCDRPHVELVRLLRLLVREHGGTTHQTLEEAMAAVKAMPHCYRAQATLGLRAGVSLGHSVTIQSLLDTAATLYPKLIAIESLPDELKGAIPKEMLLGRLAGAQVNPVTEIPLRGQMIAAFQLNEGSIGQQGQLTSPVLGHLLAEHSFLETYVRARFEKQLLGLAPDEFLDLAKPLYAWHAMAAVLDSFRSQRGAVAQAAERAARVDLDTLELQADELARLPSAESAADAKRRPDQVHFMAVLHTDSTATDLIRRYPYWPARAAGDTERAFALSPHAPAIRNHMVQHHWKKIEPQLDAWLREAETDATQLAALGVHYRNDQQIDRAIELFGQARDLAPDMDHIRLLADAYKAQGNNDRWRTTLEELLKQPDYALEHARIRVDIADDYISRHEYSRALPYAQAAAETYAGWALVKAAECHEALQQWTEAEALYRATVERYGGVGWLFFVRRTGQGDASAAQREARAALNGPTTAQLTPLVRYGVYRALDDLPRAKAELERVYREMKPAAIGGLYLALLADEQKDLPRRDAILAELGASSGPKQSPPPLRGLAALADAISKDLAVGGKASFNADALVTAKNGAPAIELGHFDYLLGKYLQLHGQRSAAEKIWLRRMSMNRMIDLSRTLCGIELVGLGIGPEKYKDALQTVLANPDTNPERADP